MAEAPPGSARFSGILVELPRVPVTALVCVAAIVLSIVGWSDVGWDPFVTDGRAFRSEPWRLFTSHLVHADVVHLALNLYWTWTFGRLLEPRLGSGAFAALVGFLAVGVDLGCHAFDSGGIGLSGIGYGLWAFLAVGARRFDALRGLVGWKIDALFVAWFLFCIALTAADFYAISNWGHGMGALLGAIAAGTIPATLRWTARSSIAPACSLLVLLAAATVLRERVNFGAGADADLGEAWAAAQRGEWENALARSSAAVRLDPENGDAWWMQCYVLDGLHRHEDAADAAMRSFELGMKDAERLERTRIAVLGRSTAALEAKDPERALEWARSAVRVAPEHADSWWSMCCAQVALDRREAAEESAFRSCELGTTDPERLAWMRDAWMQRTAAELEAGRPDRALECAQRAARVAPDVAAVWENVRVTAERAGDATAVARAESELARLGAR